MNVVQYCKQDMFSVFYIVKLVLNLKVVKTILVFKLIKFLVISNILSNKGCRLLRFIYQSLTRSLVWLFYKNIFYQLFLNTRF